MAFDARCLLIIIKLTPNQRGNTMAKKRKRKTTLADIAISSDDARWFHDESLASLERRQKNRRALIRHGAITALFLGFSWVIYWYLNTTFGAPPEGPPIVIWLTVTVALLSLLAWHQHHVHIQDKHEQTLENSRMELLASIHRNDNQHQFDVSRLEEQYEDDTALSTYDEQLGAHHLN